MTDTIVFSKNRSALYSVRLTLLGSVVLMVFLMKEVSRIPGVGFACLLIILLFLGLLWRLQKVDLTKRLLVRTDGFVVEDSSDELIPWDTITAVELKEIPLYRSSAWVLVMDKAPGAIFRQKFFRDEFRARAKRPAAMKALYGENSFVLNLGPFAASPNEIHQAFSDALLSFQRRSAIAQARMALSRTTAPQQAAIPTRAHGPASPPLSADGVPVASTAAAMQADAAAPASVGRAIWFAVGYVFLFFAIIGGVVAVAHIGLFFAYEMIGKTPHPVFANRVFYDAMKIMGSSSTAYFGCRHAGERLHGR